ncbi:ATP-binding protein [Polaromonas glacialis]|uniref:ATP-binding protein n=1 Tax=Polaromonas glacialis TaxID=866564 RepID=UPI0018DB2524|nr:ATP-binding protein [Polaromonas glacialis]
MPNWLSTVLDESSHFMPHGHCYLWLPGLLWMHVVSDFLIGAAYLVISVILYLLVRRIRLPFSPLFIAFGLFIGLCGLTHFMKIWTVWNPDYLADGLLKVATAIASVATAVGLLFVRPKVEEMVNAARVSEARRVKLESTHAELQSLYTQVRQLDMARTRFFANVSHELRTPLALILGPVERMLGEPGLTPGQRRQMESISRNSKSLLKQVNDLLDIAKLEAGKMELHPVRMDLAPWFRRVSSQFEQAAEQRQMDYRIEAPDSLVAETDPDVLERVLVNLLSNAFKFTPAHGRIEARLEAKDTELLICVADSGPGIRDDQQAAIFERFHQVDESTGTDRHNKPGGTGLGLAIVKEYVQLHGGSIGVASVAGHGATFTARLPLRASAAAQVGAEPPQREPALDIALDSALHELAMSEPADGVDPVFPAYAGRPSVLVVEDSREMRAFVGGTLSEAYNVATAADGQEGLARALAQRPDLVVTDLMMPRMGGEQLVSALRARSEFNSVPVMLLTARDDDALRVQLLISGAQDYLSKPFLPQELLARADNLVTLKRAGDTLREELRSASGDIEGLAKALALKHRQLQTALDSAEVAREQAERASQVKGYFLGMISHELRTPLSTIHLNAQLLARSRAAPTLDAPDPRIDRLTRAARQMSTLVEGLLEYTRTESAKVVAQLETVDLAALAGEVVEAHADSTPPDVRLVLAPPPEHLPPLTTDPRLLRVVMSNLVSNALKFTRQGSVTVRLASSGGWHSFEVVDTGTGIAEADQARVFLPFEQLEPVQRKSIPGVGLGLALVWKIVESLGGKVELVSALDSGSTFRVLLPSQHISLAPR